MPIKYIDILDTTFSDGFDTIYNSAIEPKLFLPVLEYAKSIGLDHFEISNSFIFNSTIKDLQKNPFEIFTKIRETIGEEANLQIEVNATNTFLKEPVSYDILELFINLMQDYEITTIRSYDTLNDMRNLEPISFLSTNKHIMHEATIFLNEINFDANIFNVEFYKNKIEEMLDNAVAFDSICFKDISGTTTPAKVYEIIKMAKELLGEELHIRFASYNSISSSVSSYLAALEAGADGLDVSISPVNSGNSLVDLLSLLYVTKDLPYNLNDIDIKKLFEYQKFLKDKFKKLKEKRLPDKANNMVIFAPFKGSDLYKFYTQFKDDFFHIFKKAKAIIKDVGYPILYENCSFYIWKQAYLNQKYGDYENIDKNFAKLILGYFGRTPISSNPKIVDLIEEKINLPFNTKPPIDLADILDSQQISYWENKLEAKNIEVTDENIYLALALQ